MEQIICQNLAIGYDGKVLLQDINFSVKDGDYLCIIGENGSGKSTLMRTLLNLQQPIRGKITFGAGVKSDEIGYLPQQTIIQRDFPASVREIILSGCQNRVGMRPFYNRSEKKRASEMMEKLQITNLTNRCYRELSGGQQQRVLLARALCATKKILLLDEPVSGLDPKVTDEMYRIVEKIKSGIDIESLFISTFTKKAAAELRMRLEKDLKKASYKSQDSIEKQRIKLALQKLPHADIGTMDSFTQKLLRENFNRVDIDPNFRILADQTESDLLKQEVFDDLVEQYLSEQSEIKEIA